MLAEDLGQLLPFVRCGDLLELFDCCRAFVLRGRREATLPFFVDLRGPFLDALENVVAHQSSDQLVPVGDRQTREMALEEGPGRGQ